MIVLLNFKSSDVSFLCFNSVHFILYIYILRMYVSMKGLSRGEERTVDLSVVWAFSPTRRISAITPALSPEIRRAAGSTHITPGDSWTLRASDTFLWSWPHVAGPRRVDMMIWSTFPTFCVWYDKTSIIDPCWDLLFVPCKHANEKK